MCAAPSSWEKMLPALKRKVKNARRIWTWFLAITALSLMFTIPFGVFAQDSNESLATFNERFPADQTSTQPSLETQDAKKERNVTTTTRTVRVKRVPTATRLVGIKRTRSRVVVVPRGPRWSAWVAPILRVGFSGPLLGIGF
jgi:hypothetical protein